MWRQRSTIPPMTQGPLPFIMRVEEGSYRHREVEMGWILGIAVFFTGLMAESLLMDHADRFAFEESVAARLARYGGDRRKGNE